MSKVSELHKLTSPKSVGLCILTVSTSRFNQLQAGGGALEDKSGDLIERLATRAGHRIEGRKLISDSKQMIRRAVKEALASKGVDALVVTGGTGLAPRDITIETVAPFLTKEIPGFGELFRKVSFDSVGSAAMLSRAFAGLVKGKAIFCLPGSPDAVQTAMEQLILPELGHVLRIAKER